MTRAVFEAETKGDLKHFVALARKQGISVKYLRVSLNEPEIKTTQRKTLQNQYDTKTSTAMQKIVKENLVANIKQGFSDKKSIDKGKLKTFPIESLFDE